MMNQAAHKQPLVRAFAFDLGQVLLEFDVRRR